VASRRKRVTVRRIGSKAAKRPTKVRKKLGKGAVTKKSRRVAKKMVVKTRQKKRATQRTRVRQTKRIPTPVVEDTVIDVVDEPIPGVMRVTEIEEVSVAVPEADDDEE
jgi:hypothetical protein